MPWELSLINYDGKPPRLRTDEDERRKLPLGTLDEVRDHISSVWPETTWTVEPPLLEMMKASGNDLWKHWSEEMVAYASESKLRGLYQGAGFTVELFGFEQHTPLRFLLLDVRGRGNPIPVLKALCEPKGWCIAEMGKDGEYLNFATAEKKWDKWQRYLSAAIEGEEDDDSDE
jgi:hypothetical protein